MKKEKGKQQKTVTKKKEGIKATERKEKKNEKREKKE